MCKFANEPSPGSSVQPVVFATECPGKSLRFPRNPGVREKGNDEQGNRE
jgi:hypothetical protein